MEQELTILLTIRQLGTLNFGQISRFLFGAGILPEFDLLPPLAVLKQKGYVSQVLGPQGIILKITQQGDEFLSAYETLIPHETRRLIAEKSATYSSAYQQEQNYLAQYSEQSSGTVPISLSIRDNTKIALKVNILVRDVETAKKICDAWIKNSARAYDAFWAAIAEGEPDPGYWSNRPQ